MEQDKLDAIREWPALTMVTEVRFYRAGQLLSASCEGLLRNRRSADQADQGEGVLLVGRCRGSGFHQTEGKAHRAAGHVSGNS